MTKNISLRHYPVFRKGIFARHPAIFDNYVWHSSGEYTRGRETLHKYEGAVTWPLVTGPGFCGATHPGAENIFVSAMTGANNRVYNSDCLYINYSQNIFAIADSPGVSTFSRQLFTKLDSCLQESSVNDLETILNRLNKETNYGDSTTLSLICLSRSKSGNGFAEAKTFVAGDTYLFHGNLLQKKMARVEGSPYFIGAAHICHQVQTIELSPGDFFVIASDGVTPVYRDGQDKKLEDYLHEHAVSGPGNFAYRVIQNCNRVFTQRAYRQIVWRFGGSDNVSALLVYPEKLQPAMQKDPLILGGYVQMGGLCAEGTSNR